MDSFSKNNSINRKTTLSSNNSRTEPPKIDPHKKEMNSGVRRASRFIELATKLYGENKGSKEKKSVNDLINEVTPETAIKILNLLNTKLLNAEKKTKIAYGDEYERKVIISNSIGGQQEYIAPEESIQKDLFKKYLIAIQELDDRDQRALLAYYGINNLHLFEDGNGRTSRAVYSLIRNNSLIGETEELIHKNGEDKTGRSNFISKYHIKPAEQARADAAVRLQSKLIKAKYIEDEFSGNLFSINSILESGAGFIQLQPEVIGEENYYGLNLKEHVAITYALSDGTRGEHHSTIAGLVMAIALQRKGTLDKIAKENLEEDGKHVSFTINCDEYLLYDEQLEKAQNLFANWHPEDFKRMISNYRMLKMLENTTLISMITENK